MKLSYLNFKGFRLSTIGLGGSRFGSITGATKKEAESLVTQALDQGITFFDTASSYGQGDSERILGRVLDNNDEICLVSKIGKVVPMKAKLIKPIKGLVRMSTRRYKQMGTQIKQSRGDKLPVCFDDIFLQAEIDKSRRRIGLSCIPMVMLHSATENILRQGDAIEFLENQRKKGNVRMVGVSVDDLSAVGAALNDPRISAIQLPFHENDNSVSELINLALQKGKLIIAREIFHGVKILDVKDRIEFVERNLQRAFSNKGIGVSLVGTLNPKHLDEIAERWRNLSHGRA